MTLRLAVKNLKAKPVRTLAAVLVTALSVAMFFCMFSFGGAVYGYVYAVETADAGGSDILIKAKSSGDRLALVDPLFNDESIAGAIEYVSPSLSLYGLASADGEEKGYVRARGFDADKLELLNGLNVTEGSLDDLLSGNPSNVAVSRAAAEAFGLAAGDTLTVRTAETVYFRIAAICENDGYFFSDAPYTLIGYNADGVSRLLGGSLAVYNEIYVKAAVGVDKDALIDKISSLGAYENLSVGYAAETGYVRARADGISAPVTVAGGAVALLAVVGIVLVYAMSVSEKRAYAAKLALCGATKKQLCAVFAAEGAVTAAVGALVGAGIACGAFALLLRLVLSSTLVFHVDGGLLAGAVVSGFAIAFASSLYPLVKAFGSSPKENMNDLGAKRRLANVTAAAVCTAAALVCLLTEYLAPAAKGALSVVNVVLSAATAALWAPLAVRFAAKRLTRTTCPVLKVSGYAAAREKRVSRGASLLTAGLFAVMLLFTAWSLTTSVFNEYTAEFGNMVLVTNVPSDVDTDEFGAAADSVDKAVAMVWRQADMHGAFGGMTVNILGSSDALDLLDFAYVTPRADVESALAQGKAVLDYSMSELYGTAVGDEIVLEMDGTARTFTVGGIVRHKFFNGRYAIVSEEALAEAFGVYADTVALVVTGDASAAAEEIRTRFAERNYYAVSAVDAYEWDVRSLENIFDLIGTLAFVIAVIVFAVTAAAAVSGRSASADTRSSLMCAGLSRTGLLTSEVCEFALTAAAAIVFALPFTALAVSSLINALRLFGLYYEFMFTAWVAAVSGLAVAALYTALPVIFGFRRGYVMRRK